ncbi:hypothetical protein PHJA_001903700 [Phtheirospermum japonicum]|uniref:UBA domain-containing protein n=1 Tax=Phtheirospermum japonicum TaxID=374723 RepID=A0A830CEG2_9LAMI|nr:hypothetical protein PHJA_001903700 [Phtheirospermum japonicum]
MSPASRSKSKDKKASKEPPKGSSKLSVHVNTSSGAPASGYNPLLGTFHTFETPPVPTANPLHANSRFRNIDDSDDHNGNSSVNGAEYDSVSNTGSWSGESEDQKEKTTQPNPRPESVPGADNDKGEKIRLKNERKHQRQKERRAQELHERCSGYLMSRKLEALAQQLVAMGFSHERATMALILNEGRVEESVAWLFESGEEDKRAESNLNSGGNLKIDISEELARITEMENRYKASKQEVERVVVSSEGDLHKAEEILKVQKDEPPAVPSKPEEVNDPPIVASSKQPVLINQNPTRIQVRTTSSSTIIQQQKRDERDFNYTKVQATVGSPIDHGAINNVQVLKKVPPKPDWTKPQQIAVPAAEKRWSSSSASAGSNNPSTSFSLAPPLQSAPTPAKAEPPRFLAVGNELKNLQLGSVKEPVIVMQRPQSITPKQAPPSTSLSSSPPGPNMGWYPNSVETVNQNNGFMPSFAVSRGFSLDGVSSNPLYNQLHYQSQQQQQQYVSNSSSIDSIGVNPRGNNNNNNNNNNGLWSSRGNTSPSLAAASSLGLFSGIGTNGSSGSSPVDWKMGGSILQCDYANVDWSLDRGLLPPRPNGLWAGANYSVQNNGRSYDSFAYGVKSGMRPVPEGVGSNSEQSSGGGSQEWSSPFEEKDIFSLPRQFVSSPSL